MSKVYSFSEFVKSLVICLLSIFIFGCTENKQPNIILIMADDLGYGDLGCYGGIHVQTPNIDRLADSGVRFLDYHSNGAVCSPTRAALMTGRYQQRSGIEGVVTAAGHRHTGLSTGEYTIADYLGSTGYYTGIIGKWHLGYDTAFSPVNNGFNYFKGYVSGNVDYHSHIDQAGHFDWWMNKDTIIEEGYVTDLITDAAVEFIRKKQENPFFLYISHEAPHYPYQGRQDKADRTIGGEFPNHGSRPDTKNAYREMIEAMDEGIGEIILVLEQTGLIENTFLFFCSDNGANNTGSNQPLKGFKGKLWEGGHRVPAIAYWKDRLVPGVNDETILSMDLFPTLISIADNDLPANVDFDGQDFSRSLFYGFALQERPVFWRFKSQRAVRKGTWKLLVDGENMFLYNLDADPGEDMDLKTEYPAITDTLLVLLDQWSEEMDLYAPRTK
jgi:arylsulfatase A-like enzyme